MSFHRLEQLIRWIPRNVRERTESRFVLVIFDDVVEGQGQGTISTLTRQGLLSRTLAPFSNHVHSTYVYTYKYLFLKNISPLLVHLFWRPLVLSSSILLHRRPFSISVKSFARMYTRAIECRRCIILIIFFTFALKYGRRIIAHL